ncbi:MAG: FemAB family XrtA/PEP-CTERM system-associated protein [Desulfobulbus sp.]
MSSAASRPSIQLATKADALDWDHYILKHEEASPYHLYAWKEAVERAYAFKPYSLMALDQGKIIGVLPLIFMTYPLGGGTLVALPYCDVGGPLADNAPTAQSLLEHAINLGAHLQAKSLDIRGFSLQADQQASDYYIEKKQEKVRMLFHLPDTVEELWQGFRSKLRSQINKARKNGLTFCFSENLAEFYSIFASNMHDLGSPVHSYNWFQAIFAHYGKRARLGLVFKGDRAVGGGIVLNTDRVISIPWASTLRVYNHLSPNMLLYWSLLEDAVNRGFSTFDFGRSTSGEGTYRFKSQWGAQPVELNWYVVNFSKGQSDKVMSQRPSNIANRGITKRMVAAKLWRLLPAWFVNRTGPILRKYVSL